MKFTFVFLIAALTGSIAQAQFMFGDNAKAGPQPKAAAPAAPVAPAAPIAPAQNSNLDKFQCGKSYAEDLDDVGAIFKEVLGIDGVHAGRTFYENEGYSGNRVVLRIKNTRTFQMTLVRSGGGDLPAKVCWRNDGGRKSLSIQVDASSLGYSRYNVSVNKLNSPQNNQVYLRGSGELSQLLDFGYTLR